MKCRPKLELLAQDKVTQGVGGSKEEVKRSEDPELGRQTEVFPRIPFEERLETSLQGGQSAGRSSYWGTKVVQLQDNSDQYCLFQAPHWVDHSCGPVTAV